jgi:hypothetical protein
LSAHSMLSTIISCVLLLSMALSGCGTISKPNTPFAEPIDELNYIEKKNPLLAMEIRKLPDILDGLNNDERKALQRLSEIYAAQTSDFESAFAEMYKIGLPEHRKYCSPLQALLWIAMESSFSKEKNPIKPYALSNLLDEAWIFDPKLSAHVDFYVKKQINYSNYWEIPGYSGNIGNPHYVFKYKKGDCLYTSAFIVEALRRNGYSAWIEKMPPLRSVDSFHAVCVLEIQGEKYIIDDGKEGYKRGIMKYDEY